MTQNGARLGMLLKGYPRISESFISTELLLLESLGIPIEIYSLRRPRENFAHEHVKHIAAPVTYLPEYVLPNLRTLAGTNLSLLQTLGRHYIHYLGAAVKRAFERRKPATLRHFLQAGCLARTRLCGSGVRHIHAHFCHTPASVAFFASELTGIPFSFTAHAKDIYTSEPEQLARKIHKARFVVTCTKHNARYLHDIAGNNGCHTPIHTVYHGIDLGSFTFSAPSDPAPPFRILSVGRMVPKKGFDDLLRALHILDRAGLDFHFTHVGTGESEPQIRSLIRQLDLGRKVALLGTLPHRDVIPLYRTSHCFALACKIAPNGDRDGIPNVLVEAMATGLPVVSTNVSAIPELVEDGTTGRLVGPEDPPGLARAIREVLTCGERSRELAARAREKVERDFDNRKCVGRLHALFHQVLASP
ncbi:MAG: glycosyltransferase [Syntrophobacteraceae bacterium]|nr:glycosyltransferase [Desulfobacteraceae bacterium]